MRAKYIPEKAVRGTGRSFYKCGVRLNHERYYLWQALSSILRGEKSLEVQRYAGDISKGKN